MPILVFIVVQQPQDLSYSPPLDGGVDASAKKGAFSVDWTMAKEVKNWTKWIAWKTNGGQVNGVRRATSRCVNSWIFQCWDYLFLFGSVSFFLGISSSSFMYIYPWHGFYLLLVLYNFNNYPLWDVTAVQVICIHHAHIIYDKTVNWKAKAEGWAHILSTSIWQKNSPFCSRKLSSVGNFLPDWTRYFFFPALIFRFELCSHTTSTP